MQWKVFVCEHVEYMDDDGYVSKTEPAKCVKVCNDYSEAIEFFKENLDNADYDRIFIKVYGDGERARGDILCASSMLWGDNIFNENAV